PRWILPLLCRRGHITRNEIGAIRIGPVETHFQVPRPIVDRFKDALRRTAGDTDGEEGILIEPSDGAPREAARQNRKFARSGHTHSAPAKYSAKPHRKGPGRHPGAQDKQRAKPGPRRKKDH
ncbi:MAG: DbpA RNA binding domain-containing protein, partial [Novosphingobium sp.]|nr:DbpA RNA binding domain-containing protein [Novosphingobium sp.]